ncbi:MAG: TRAP transporter fused permease subunit, partial [Betaproteobacteria bacterium]|nr:TRAP transporter fused permease subunit [Betaproteobacteria bacterium]
MPRMAYARWRKAFIWSACIAMSLFHLYTAQFGMLTVLLQRSVHYTFVMLLVFLVFPLGGERHKPWMEVVDVLLMVLGVASIGYVVFNHQMVSEREPMSAVANDPQFALGLIAIALTLEAARRTVGMALVLVVSAGLAYVYLGPYFPGRFGHPGWTLNEMVSFLYLGMDGIFGIPLGVSATYAFLFILFGAFLYATGVGGYFITLATSLAGRSKGGPAKVAVLSSALFGTISGATVANVYGTGNFSIPLMKRLGYSPVFAGAVEATASTGGQIMPPVMGAVAFVMADVTGIAYVNIALAALLPALIYFFALIMMVHFEAHKKNLQSLPPSEIPPRKVVLSRSYLLLPVVFLVYILIDGYSPFRAAFFAIIATVLVSLVRKETRLSVRGFFDTLAKGAQESLLIATATAAAGLIVGCISMTGIALQVTNLITGISGETLIVPLILAMVACIIMGMGMPTVPAYIIVASIAVPAIVKLGVPVIAAHMFALYFAVVAAITPPVAIAAYAAASISGGNMFRTGVTASRLGIAAFVVPYMFVYSPALLLIGPWGWVAFSVVTALVGTASLAA